MMWRLKLVVTRSKICEVEVSVLDRGGIYTEVITSSAFFGLKSVLS